MPQSPAIIERQLEQAKSELAVVEGNLENIEPRKHPKWREVNGRCKQLERRLAAHQAKRGSANTDTEE